MLSELFKYGKTWLHLMSLCNIWSVLVTYDHMIGLAKICCMCPFFKFWSTLRFWPTTQRSCAATCRCTCTRRSSACPSSRRPPRVAASSSPSPSRLGWKKRLRSYESVNSNGLKSSTLLLSWLALTRIIRVHYQVKSIWVDLLPRPHSEWYLSLLRKPEEI